MPGPVSDVLYRIFGWPSCVECPEASVSVQCVAFLAVSVRCILWRTNQRPCLLMLAPVSWHLFRHKSGQQSLKKEKEASKKGSAKEPLRPAEQSFAASDGRMMRECGVGTWTEHIPHERNRVARGTFSMFESDRQRGDGDSDASTATAQKAIAGAGASSQSPRPVTCYGSWHLSGWDSRSFESRMRALSGPVQGEVAEGGSGGRRLGQEVFAARAFEDSRGLVTLVIT